MRGQTAFEFLVLVGFMVLVFTSFTLLMERRSADLKEQVHREELVSIAEQIAQEVVLASKVDDGYSRVFSLPGTVRGGSYAIALEPQGAQSLSEIVVSSGDEEYIFFLQQNLTPLSDVGPGYNLVTKQSGNISIGSLGWQEFACEADADCGTGSGQCYERYCVNAQSALATCKERPKAPGSACPPQNPLGCKSYACDGAGSCLATDTCPHPLTCIDDGAGGACKLVCVPGKTQSRLRAGTDGTDWTPAGVTSQADTGLQGICCDAASQCAWNRTAQGQKTCWDTGEYLNNAWVCEDPADSFGPTWLKCYETPDKKGVVVEGKAGAEYCCSKNLYGNFVFNSTPVWWKGESGVNGAINGCTDGYDNDCNGLIDGLDPACATCPVPSPTNLATQSITWNSVSLGWTPRTGSETTGQAVRVGPSLSGVDGGCTDGSCNIKQDLPAGDPDYVLGEKAGDTALLPAKQYFVRLVNFDSDSFCTPQYGNAALSFLTPPRLRTECNSGSAEEDLVLEQNLAGTNFVYDWLKGGSSRRKLFFTFDIHNNPSSGKTKDYGCTFVSCTPHDGTLAGVDYKTAECTKPNGEASGCYYFTADDRIDVQDGIFSSTTADFTMSAWVKVLTTTKLDYYVNFWNPNVPYREGLGYFEIKDQRFVFSPSRTHSYGSGHRTAGFTVGTNGVIVWEYRQDAMRYYPVLIYPEGTEFGTASGEGVPEDRIKSNSWHHVAVAYRGGTPHLYIDGRYVDTGIKSSSPVHPAENIGGFRYAYNGQNYYNDFYGYIDDPAVHDAAIGPGEMRKQYLGLRNQVHEDELLPGEQWQGCVLNISNGKEGNALCSAKLSLGAGTSACAADKGAGACMAAPDMTAKSPYHEQFGDQGKAFVTGTWGEGGSAQCCGESESEWYVQRAVVGSGTSSPALCCPTESHCVAYNSSTAKYECIDPHTVWNEQYYCWYNGIIECKSSTNCMGANVPNANYMCTSTYRNVGGYYKRVYYWERKSRPIESCS